MRFTRVASIACLMLGGVVVSQLAPPAHAGAESARPPATAAKESPFACNRNGLTANERKRHFDELGPQLRALRTGVHELPDGYEFDFPGDPATYRLLTEWAVGERSCCPFFDLDVLSEREGGPVRLRVTGRPGVKQFIEVDAAEWTRK